MIESDTLRVWIMQSIAGPAGESVAALRGDEAAMRRCGAWQKHWGSLDAELARMEREGLIVLECGKARIVPQSRIEQKSLF